jgi:hypothetical protein
MAGTLVSCAVIGKSGRRLTGKEAARGLSRLGRLRWTFTPQQEVPATESLPATTAQTAPMMSFSPIMGEVMVYPRRYIVYLDQQQMRSWSRMHRAVFSLADGTKSVVKIAEMLSTSPALVEKALRELQSIGVIILEPRNR